MGSKEERREEEISNVLEEIIEGRLEGGFTNERWIFFIFFIEKLTSLGREPSTNRTILDTLRARIGEGLLGTGFDIDLWCRVGL